MRPCLKRTPANKRAKLQTAKPEKTANVMGQTVYSGVGWGGELNLNLENRLHHFSFIFSSIYSLYIFVEHLFFPRLWHEQKSIYQPHETHCYYTHAFTRHQQQASTASGGRGAPLSLNKAQHRGTVAQHWAQLGISWFNSAGFHCHSKLFYETKRC